MGGRVADHHACFQGGDEAGKQALHLSLLEFLGRWNRGGDRPQCVPSEYLEVVLTK